MYRPIGYRGDRGVGCVDSQGAMLGTRLVMLRAREVLARKNPKRTQASAGPAVPSGNCCSRRALRLPTGLAQRPPKCFGLRQGARALRDDVPVQPGRG